MKSRACLLALLTALATQAGLLEDMGIDSDASRQVKEQPYGPQGVTKPPAQHAGAEGAPGGGGPVVPMRRTEKKNPPRPPVLLAKLATSDRVDWATSPEDTENLLKFMAKELNVHFSTINLPQNKIPADASEVPVLYRSGLNGFAFTPQIRQRLRSYLLSGGTLVLNAYCGHPDFARSAMQEIQQLLPERPPYRLAEDHPLYHSYFDIEQIRYRPLALEAGAQHDLPSAIGIDINTRTAVFFFRYDISSAWENIPDDYRHCIGYDIPTAKKLGANLMAYITAERNTAISLARSLEFVDESDQRAGKFMIAQARYDGLWKTRDDSLAMLLNVFHEKTTAPVRFESLAVDLDSKALFEVPFVYLTGQMDFQLTPEQRAGLQRYLLRGGILFAEATAGRPTFDRAFRRELKQILPEAALTRLPTDHLIYRFPNTVQQVAPRPALAARLQVSGPLPPVLYGATVNGHLAVIYSPYDLSGGWSLAEGPYNEGIQANDALALGVNILTYALTQ